MRALVHFWPAPIRFCRFKVPVGTEENLQASPRLLRTPRARSEPGVYNRGVDVRTAGQTAWESIHRFTATGR